MSEDLIQLCLPVRGSRIFFWKLDSRCWQRTVVRLNHRCRKLWWGGNIIGSWEAVLPETPIDLPKIIRAAGHLMQVHPSWYFLVIVGHVTSRSSRTSKKDTYICFCFSNLNTCQYVWNKRKGLRHVVNIWGELKLNLFLECIQTFKALWHFFTSTLDICAAPDFWRKES
jgi:hypothetical protein